MKKIFGFVFFCVISMSLSSCIGCSSSNEEVKHNKSYGRYHNPYGGRQEYYQGSVEQQRDLAEIDAYFNEHGWD